MIPIKDIYAFGFSKDVDTKYIKTYQYLKNNIKLDGKVTITQNKLNEAYLPSIGRQSHASFIEQLPDGTLLIAFFVGECEGVSNVSIAISRLEPNTHQWSNPMIVSRLPYKSNQNPVLYYDKIVDRVRLFHTTQVARDSPFATKSNDSYGGQFSSKIVEMISSDAQGLVWNNRRMLFNELGSFLRDRVIEINDNEFILPMYMTPGKKNTHYSVIKRYNRKNNMWTTEKIENSIKLVQPSIIKYGENQLKAFFRNRDGKIRRICTMNSNDNGKTWTQPIISKLVNGNCGIATCLLNDKKHLLVAYTNSDSGNRRSPLSVAVSTDLGNTFIAIKDLMPHGENIPEHVYTDAEFSYPSMLQTPDEKIHVTYTYNRITIGYLSFTLEWLLNQAKNSIGVNHN